MKGLNRQWRWVGMVIGFALLAYLVMDFNGRMAELQRLSGEAGKISEDVRVLEATKAFLEEQIQQATSAAPVEEWAYVDGKMVRQGDVPIVLISPGDVTPTPIPLVVETPEPQNNWQVWLDLFFDKNLP